MQKGSPPRIQIRRIIFPLLVWVFPIFLLDGCINSERYLRIDDHYSVVASWSGQPHSLTYRAPEGSFQIGEMPNYGIHDRAFISDLARIFPFPYPGKPKSGWWIVDRATNEPLAFSSREERDAALAERFHLKPSDFRKTTAWESHRSRFGYPHFDLFYLCTIFIVVAAEWIRTRKRAVSKQSSAMSWFSTDRGSSERPSHSNES